MSNVEMTDSVTTSGTSKLQSINVNVIVILAKDAFTSF